MGDDQAETADPLTAGTDGPAASAPGAIVPPVVLAPAQAATTAEPNLDGGRLALSVRRLGLSLLGEGEGEKAATHVRAKTDKGLTASRRARVFAMATLARWMARLKEGLANTRSGGLRRAFANENLKIS